MRPLTDWNSRLRKQIDGVVGSNQQCHRDMGLIQRIGKRLSFYIYSCTSFLRKYCASIHSATDVNKPGFSALLRLSSALPGFSANDRNRTSDPP
jgi:hypothetical protein